MDAYIGHNVDGATAAAAASGGERAPKREQGCGKGHERQESHGKGLAASVGLVQSLVKRAVQVVNREGSECWREGRRRGRP